MIIVQSSTDSYARPYSLSKGEICHAEWLLRDCLYDTSQSSGRVDHIDIRYQISASLVYTIRIRIKICKQYTQSGAFFVAVIKMVQADAEARKKYPY